MGKYLWLAVTVDEYELPLCVEDSSYKLGLRLGVTRSTIESSANRNESGKNSGRKIVKVKI